MAAAAAVVVAGQRHSLRKNLDLMFFGKELEAGTEEEQDGIDQERCLDQTQREASRDQRHNTV